MSISGQASASLVELTVSDGEFSAPVLERLISAAASRADLPIDRIVDALAAVDALVVATDRVFEAAENRQFSVEIEPGEVRLAVNGLQDGQAESLLGASHLPALGGILERMATSVATKVRPDGETSLILAFT